MSILAIGTAVPPKVYQQEMLERMLEGKAAKIFRNSAIDTRHFVAEIWDKTHLSTADRNEIYMKEAPRLAVEAAKEALEKWGGDPSEITHVISISCTGFMAPGIEFLVMDALGLSRSINRLGINFMGCFGGFKGLATARALAQDPKARVLFICTELCSLHYQPDALIGNALFSDGAAAVIVGQEEGLWEIVSEASLALEDSLEEMTWECSDYGYQMKLTEKVPLHIRQQIRTYLPQLLGEVSIDQCDFAFHPGGKAILHTLKQAFSLSQEQLAASYEVMGKYGNMSSATILFVLDAMRPEREWCAAVGFGPGLSIEGVLLRR